MADLLIVEDDHTVGLSLQASLSNEGHNIQWCRTVKQALVEIEASPDLIILDLGLPDGDGLALCRSLRAQGNISPILMLTARGTVSARVDGLEAGADDYLPKPFELPELIARIEVLLRRQRWHNRGSRVVVGELSIDFKKLQAWKGDTIVHLTELEYKLLRYLLERQGEAVPRPNILADVWGLHPDTRTRAVDVLVGRLRKHLEKDAAKPQVLVNVRGVGYRLKLD